VADIDWPDNPWSAPSRELRIACEDCAEKWVLHFESELRDRAVSEASSQVWRKLYEIDKELEALGREAIDEIFETTPQPSFKAERQVLVSAGLCTKGPIVYPRERNAGQTAGSMCNPLRNITWIRANVANVALADRIDALASEKGKLETQLEQLAKQMNPIQLSSLASK
jgi:hypothetical protein